MTRLRRPTADGSDLVVCPKAKQEFADLMADLGTIGETAPDVEDQEDDLSWVSTLYRPEAQVAAPAAPVEIEENQASAPAPVVSAPVIPSPSPAIPTTSKTKKPKTPRTATAKPDRTDLAAQVGERIKAAGSVGVRSDTLEADVCRSASQRVGDLRRQGWVITSEPVVGSEVVRYVYVGMTTPRPIPTAGVRLYTYEDGSVESRSFVGVSDLDESAQLADHLAGCAAAWIAARSTGAKQVTP